MSSTYTDDFYHRQAGKEGWRSRSFFKLEEIDRKFSIIKPHLRVLDLGAAPGSWLQYCHRKTKGKVRLFAVDTRQIASLPGVAFDCLKKDARSLSREELPEQVEVILSDMAPSTTGIHVVDSAASAELVDSVLDMASHLLKVGGTVVAKYLQGEELQELISRFRARFESVKTFKPLSSRSRSSELFFIAKKKKRLTMEKA